MTCYEIPIIDKLYVVGRGTILVVKKEDYQKVNCHINDIINDKYIISAVEWSPYGKFVGLVVKNK